jgi:hypothetical protein
MCRCAGEDVWLRKVVPCFVLPDYTEGRKFFKSQRPAAKAAHAARTRTERAISLISWLDHRLEPCFVYKSDRARDRMFTNCPVAKLFLN